MSKKKKQIIIRFEPRIVLVSSKKKEDVRKAAEFSEQLKIGEPVLPGCMTKNEDDYECPKEQSLRDISRLAYTAVDRTICATIISMIAIILSIIHIILHFA